MLSSSLTDNSRYHIIDVSLDLQIWSNTSRTLQGSGPNLWLHAEPQHLLSAAAQSVVIVFAGFP